MSVCSFRSFARPDKKKYREFEEEVDDEGSSAVLSKKSKNSNAVNYTNSTSVASQNAKKTTNAHKQVQDIDIEEMMALAERRKKIELEEKLLNEELDIPGEEEEAKPMIDRPINTSRCRRSSQTSSECVRHYFERKHAERDQSRRLRGEQHNGKRN